MNPETENRIAMIKDIATNLRLFPTSSPIVIETVRSVILTGDPMNNTGIKNHPKNSGEKTTTSAGIGDKFMESAASLWASLWATIALRI